MTDANCGDVPKPFATHANGVATVRSDVGMEPKACPAESTMCRKIDQQGLYYHIQIVLIMKNYDIRGPIIWLFDGRSPARPK